MNFIKNRTRKRIKRTIATVLAAVLIYGITGGLLNGVFAAPMPVSITVDKFENGRLDISWSRIPGAVAAVVAWHKPDNSDNAVMATSGVILSGNTASISGLTADYIYDISVTLYGEVDNSGNPIGNPVGRGLLFYLPSITFYSYQLEQTPETVTGGGVQIGDKPGLRLSWRVPKVFCDPDDKVYPETDPDASNNKFIPVNKAEAKAYMQNSLRKIYNDNRELSTLNYRINISTDLNLLNAGSAQSALLIEQDPAVEDKYKAYVSGSPDVTADVAAPDALGFVGFELWGRADEQSQAGPPGTPSAISLPDNDIFPGTVYYMNIKPIFMDASKEEVNAVTVGRREDQNGSMLAGERSYSSTPIRFQLTKDSANNIYVKIYRINQGSLDLPRLYYEVQITDDKSIQGDWTVKKTLDDSYFNGDTAITIITGVNPNNKLYYKIVVKSDGASDRLESRPLPYTLTVDTSRPPLPTGIALQGRALDIGQVTAPSGTVVTVKSTDITISWDKPLNWSTVKNNLYFHFLLNTSQAESSADAPLYVSAIDSAQNRQNILWGNYQARYRLVKYVSAASPNIKEIGNRLSYTIKAFELFKGEDESGSSSGLDIPHTVGYPGFLLPNTVYYLQMYTTTAENRGSQNSNVMSDKSVIFSFTTLSGAERDVPLPMSFGPAGNGKDTSVSPVRNYIELKFDKVANLDWRNYTDIYDKDNYSYETYYDIYMNTHTDTRFIKIGSTENLDGDIVFTGADDPQSTSVKARITEFTADDSVNMFGHSLLPNTTYYFTARTRLVQRTSQGAIVLEKESMDTAILPVTTVVLTVTPPDDSQRKPLAPTDFSIALDSSQQPLLTGNSVTFTWKRQENDVIYQMIRTSQKVNPTDLPPSYSGDPENVSFLKEYANYPENVSGSAVKDRFYIDPAKNNSYGGKFAYDPATKMCTFTVDRRMYPNRLYYFSLKAVRVNSERTPLQSSSESVWVSIPVTTSLIDSPASLEAVVDAELGFFWDDPTNGLTADDYKIYAKISSESGYRLMNKAQASIVKDKDGRTYYGRITGLRLNTYYDVRVTKGSGTPVYEKTGFKTRDGFHELEIKWIGKSTDDYSRYDIALMAEGGKEYTILTATDMEQYEDKNGRVLPYYTEETAQTIGTDNICYHARIKSAEVNLPGGIATHQYLRSNTKYYVKVRAVRIDPTETDLISYSKYIGPVNIRTEFNQSDYDNTDRQEKQKAVFLDRMEELEKGYYWRISTGDGGTTSILLKGDRVADALKNSSANSFVVDMTKLSVNINKDEIYVPIGVIKAMNALNKSLVIRTASAELALRPSTLDASGNGQIKDILSRQEVKDLYIRLSISRLTASVPALPASLKRVSDINELDVQAWGLSKTDGDLKQLFHDKLYDKDSGLVTEKLNMLQNTYVGEGTGSSALIEQYAQNLITLIEKEMSSFINTTLDSAKLTNAVRDITTFDTPASESLAAGNTSSAGSLASSGSGGSESGKGLWQPYVLYDDSAAWQKISSGSVQGSIVRFDIIKTGRYVILASQTNISDVPADHPARSYIEALASKYDLSGVFAGIGSGFMPENKATCTEVVLLYETVTGKTAEDAGLDIRRKLVKLGLDGIISANNLPKSVKRQEIAAVLVKLFSVKKGVDPGSLRPRGIIDIADGGEIEDAFYNQVLVVVDMKVMSPDGGGKFYPNGQITRAELAEAFAKLLNAIGE